MLNRLGTLIGIAACGAGAVARPVAAQLPAAASASMTVPAHDTITRDLVVAPIPDWDSPRKRVPFVPMAPPLVLTHTSAWSSAGEPVTTLYATEAKAGNGICLADGQIDAHDSTVEWRILGVDRGVCANASGHTMAFARFGVAPGRYALVIASGGVTDTLTMTVAADRTVIGPDGRQRIIRIAQRVAWRAPVRSFVMWCSPKRPDGRECEAMRDALEAEPDLAELPGASPPVASGYGSGHPLPFVATAYQYVWDAEFDRVRELIRELGSSAPDIAGCSNVLVLNWRGERSDITPCRRSPGE